MKRKRIIGSTMAVVALLLVSIMSYANAEGGSVHSKFYSNTTETENFPQYFLDGTILDGTMKVIVTKDGHPPEGIESDDYDVVISHNEERNITEKARQKYLATYGIDPYETVDKKLDLYDFFFHAHFQKNINDMRRGVGPHQIDGKIICNVVHARDIQHRPRIPSYLSFKTYVGHNSFDIFDVETEEYSFYGYWDASDVTSGKLIDFYYDLQEDCGGTIRTDDNQVIMGWVRDGSEGSGWGGGFYGIGKESSIFSKDCIAQHEISHCYGAPDHGWSLFDFCIMSYFWLFFKIDRWCDPCKLKIQNNIWE